ncbi:hypothetical protein [Thermococcus sp.]
MGKLDGIELEKASPFEEPRGNRVYRSLMAMMVALIFGVVFSYLFDEKIGVFIFIQALFTGMVSFTKQETPRSEPYIIGNSSGIVYLTKEELRERLKKKETSLNNL